MHQPENPARRTLLGQAVAGSAALALGSLLGSAAGRPLPPREPARARPSTAAASTC
ncbi:betaine aldehyde dehydrogenase [Pseudomonas aeruginosa]|nr:betaine aldehyde dehydrogenase [Pseudomonas aeruginosa]